ncbi:MAG: S46 family peptidase [Ignavibacteriales bacterium]|nr:S46 family peptidase [Ignavibacteriales bacterium]
MFKQLITIILFVIIFTNISFTDEGMYPLSEIHKLNLREKGLKISSKDIYNSNGVGIIDAIVNVGGCTGSFISSEGLIITNHHCAFGAVQSITTKENDYVTDGFFSKNRDEERQAKGLTIRITEYYRDVSKEVLSVVSDTMEFISRSKAIEKKMKEIVLETEKNNSGKRAEVSEMFPGKSYMLFIYTFLKDVRLVYVPPRSIGEFGGEEDNWVWPRHTGDFSFLRAYVAPDGSPAEYSVNNIPYHPRKFLKINPNGVEENDAVFILGYPGRTFRHRTSHYLSYEEDIRLRYIQELYAWEISVMENLGKDNREVAIKHDARIKSLANVEKNFRGKLQGMKRLHLADKKKKEEEELQRFIESDAKRVQLYGTVLSKIDDVYKEMRANAQKELLLDNFRQSSTLLNTAYTLYEASIEMRKPDIERESQFMERNIIRTKESVMLTLKNYFEETDKIFLKKFLLDALSLPFHLRISAVDEVLQGDSSEKAIDAFIQNAFQHSQLHDEKIVQEAFAKYSDDLEKMNDAFISFAKKLYPTYRELKEVRQRRDGELNKLFALLVDVKKEFQKKEFIPDANSTLRLTFGTIKGYSPADALYTSPITTVNGIVQKNNSGRENYSVPEKILDLYSAKDFGRYKTQKLNDVPVALLYNLDTSGGNSGSPLMNERGELIGVNFDRTFDATINDYAWSELYSRSIAVDIRYVLWILEKFAGAEDLLKEMNVTK